MPAIQSFASPLRLALALGFAGLVVFLATHAAPTPSPPAPTIVYGELHAWCTVPYDTLPGYNTIHWEYLGDDQDEIDLFDIYKLDSGTGVYEGIAIEACYGTAYSDENFEQTTSYGVNAWHVDYGSPDEASPTSAPLPVVVDRTRQSAHAKVVLNLAPDHSLVWTDIKSITDAGGGSAQISLRLEITDYGTSVSSPTRRIELPYTNAWLGNHEGETSHTRMDANFFKHQLKPETPYGLRILYRPNDDDNQTTIAQSNYLFFAYRKAEGD